MAEETKVAVIGGGVTGLCTAHLLTKSLGEDAVLVLEGEDTPGGTMRTERFDGFCCDRGPNGFLDKEPLTLDWVRELALEDRVLKADESAGRRFIMKNERLIEIKGPPKFFLAPLLSIRGRARLCIEPLIPAKRDATPESIWDFAARRIGKEAADMLVSAMVTGVFGGDAKQLSLEHCFPRMAEMEREHGGLVKAMLATRGQGGGPTGPRGVLTSFEGGIGALAECAAETLGGQLRLNARVTSIDRAGAGYRVSVDGAEEVTAQSIVLCLPAYAGAKATASLDPGLSKTLASIPYASIAVVCTAYRREHVKHEVNGFGFLVPRNQNKRMLGSLWTSSIFPESVPDEDWVLLRSLYGGYNDPDAVDLSDADLLGYLEREVHPLLGIDGDPEVVRVFRHHRGIPQYLLNHGEILAQLEAAQDRLPGFALAGNAYRGVSLNDCVVSAHRAVERVVKAS